jgi:hypothetical protein
MAKRRSRRYYRRRTGRWSANISTLREAVTVPSGTGSFYSYSTLCSNPIQVETTVSQQYTVKNTQVQFELDSVNNQAAIENLTAYIMFLPQGYQVTETLPNTHPEWIMAMKYYGSPGPDANYNRNPLNIKTRLARRLQTGDGVILLITGFKDSSDTAQGLHFRGVVRWWTKAN